VTARLARQPQGSSRLETSGRDVIVFLAETIGVEVDAKTSGGRVITELPVTMQREFSKTALQAKINASGPKLMLRTSGGIIHVNPVRVQERVNASEAIWLGQKSQEEPRGEAEMEDFDPMGALALVLIFGPILAAVIGGIFIKALKILKGIPPQQSKQLRAQETKLMQEIYQGLSRMQERVEVLETILLDRQRKAGDK
jgi:phage shock protein B